MKGEIIKTLLTPRKTDSWVLIQTATSLYSFRLGGFKSEESLSCIDDYDFIKCPFAGMMIEKVYTDDEWVYFLIKGGGVIASGWTTVSKSGRMKLGVKFTNILEYEDGFFIDEDMVEL